MGYVVCLFMKTHMLALLQDNCLDLVLLYFLVQVAWMHGEYNSILSTPTKADFVLADTDISVKSKYQSNISVYL